MKLTARQKEILSKLMDIYRENKKFPVHYSLVAKYLGISKWSAYDMMRVLEGKGLVTAEYRFSAKGKSRGRTSVRFAPTVEAKKILNEIVGKDVEKEEWQIVKEQVLKKLEKLQGTDKEPLLRSILKILNNELYKK